MSESASVSSGIAERYATAVFEIAKEGNDLSKLEANLDDLSAALKDSADLRDLLTNPVYTRDQQGAAITAIANKMGVIPAVANVLALMASKRRLFVVPHMVTRLREMIAAEKGEVTADVVSATALTDAQQKSLADTLKAKIGQDVKINATVDETLIGGLVVKVGSKMIDTSVRSKLNSLQNAMKEVG
ncbi:ATP synthase F1 subcomplex delta subunit [Tropicibacter naphthalenivorans]|uniref:ATP synthase subunit delta n=1 Tax=Tropicibacter naphthalenivorans TaxID=441103 RepID=A0A0P1GEV8_9RHOB|nr:F-type ATPase subunit delta [Tropicibacter naphthalenivorans]SMC47162.1 ATP synthase F1 subcomplex delta subunit [Tropicibacter naphthalenivorans]